MAHGAFGGASPRPLRYSPQCGTSVAVFRARAGFPRQTLGLPLGASGFPDYGFPR